MSGSRSNIKQIISILLFLLVGPGTEGQQMMEKPSLVMGEKEVIRSVEILPRVFGYDSSGYYALTRTTRFGIVHYDRSMTKTMGELIQVNENLKTREIVKVIHFHDSIYLFFFTEGLNNRTLLVRNISKNSLEEENRTRVIYSLPFVRGRKPVFGIEMSRDESKLLIYSRTIHNNQKQGLLEMHVYGAGLKTVWKNSFRFTWERAPKHMNNFKVDAWGNAYMLDHLYDPPIPNLTGRPNKLMILAISDSGEKSNTFEIEAPARYIKNATIEPAGKDFVICSGFYSDTDLEGTVKGSFFFRVNTAYGIIQNSRDYLIPAADFTSGESFGLVINHLIYKEQGYSFLVAEQYLREEHMRYQNLYVCVFEADGEQRWEKVLPKEQAYREGSDYWRSRPQYSYGPRDYWPDGTPVYHPGQSDQPAGYAGHGYNAAAEWDRKEEVQEWDYGSYALLAPLDRDWIAVAFNDNIKNMDTESNKRFVFSSGRKSYLNLLQMDQFGYMKSHVAYLRDKKKKPVPLPTFHYDTQNGRTVFPAARGNNTFYMIELELTSN